MPLFDYECESCGSTTEKFFKPNEDQISPRCITCGIMMTKNIGIPAFKVEGGYSSKEMQIPKPKDL